MLCYLQMCLSPSSYVQFLVTMLESFTDCAESDAVHRIELMCLLGHEIRKQSQKEKSAEYFEGANSLYSKNSSAFEKNAMSEVFFINSYSDFLSKSGNRHLNAKVLKWSERALKICREIRGRSPRKGRSTPPCRSIYQAYDKPPTNKRTGNEVAGQAKLIGSAGFISKTPWKASNDCSCPEGDW